MWLVHRKLVFCLRSQVRGSVRKRNNNFQCLIFLHSCHCQTTVLKEKKFYSFLPRNSADNVFCVSKRLIYTIDAGESQAFLIPFSSQTHPTKLSWRAAEEQATICHLSGKSGLISRAESTLLTTTRETQPGMIQGPVEEQASACIMGVVRQHYL